LLSLSALHCANKGLGGRNFSQRYKFGFCLNCLGESAVKDEGVLCNNVKTAAVLSGILPEAFGKEG